MPSTISGNPFLSLRPDAECGRKTASELPVRNGTKEHANGYVNGHTNGYVNGHIEGQVNGHTNGHINGNVVEASHEHANGHRDDFLRLAAPQQELLLLHGPRQKYSLEKAQAIPELKDEREILVQTLAIGLNPVDWKGADFGFGQPAYPWVNGRDFAGIVVRASRREGSRIKQGDIVFGPSTDYRDVRKAAYQEYLVTTDSSVARLPQSIEVKEGAAVGVAYVAAAIALGVSFGLDFSKVEDAPLQSDLLRLTRALDPKEVADDIRKEIYQGISENERPQPGEWLAIWGASSTTAILALQLAKLAGLRVACVLDVAKNGSRLAELGADFLVDRYDTKRAVEILKAITGNKLRFAIDTAGKESAESLQQALQQSIAGKRSHLLGFAGLPKNIVVGVEHHNVPIKLFHEAPAVGETLMTWLEELLLAKALKMPEVEVATGGLAGINDALDLLRSGTVSGKRIVVPIETGRDSPRPPSTDGNGGTSLLSVPNGAANGNDDLAYATQLNSEPDRLKFAYWVPNVSGGLVISKIPQHTNWDLKSNQRYARTAERVGFEYALSQIRFMAGYGAENQHESVSFSQALLHSTEKLKVIAALLPGPWNPAIAAKQIASIDNYTDGRIAVNVVSGWFKTEFTSIGQWWLDHSERYRRSAEFIACLKGIWTQDKFSYRGDFYQFHDYTLKPKPVVVGARTYPEIFQGGNSDDARANAAAVSDYYFMNGNTLHGFQTQIADVKARAAAAGRPGQVRFALNGFVICRPTEAEAWATLAEIQGKADADAVEGFRHEVQNAGASTGNKTGMWAGSKAKDLVQYNDGFKTKLIGTREQIADRILLLKSLGVDILLVAFLHYDEEIQAFGEQVLPLVRELEKQGRGRDEEDEIRRTGDVYREEGEE